MDGHILPTPVVLILFNRPDLTQKVFEVISSIKPSQLFVIADGPRYYKAEDIEQCHLTRSIIDAVDWPCEIHKNYSDINLGSNQRISSGLDWVFDQVEFAIILEDDCLPHPTFFRFCAELLEKYRYDERIMTISGNNFQFGRKRTQESYYFSHYNHCWGWATWRRAWQHYDIEMKHWPEVRNKGWLNDLLNNPFAVRYWQKKFQGVYENKIDTWDFRFTFACWIHSGLTILPNVNLVSNIGFGRDSTHTRQNKSPFSALPTQEIIFPLVHPEYMIRDRRADAFTQSYVFGFWNRAQRKIRDILGM
jgi:hypothetical protein